MTIYSQSEELVSRCIECDLAEPESLASLGGSAPGLLDGILSQVQKEEITHDIQEPKGKLVTATTYVDANLHHDQVTGRAGTGCLLLVNATPSHLHTKRQATVETATFDLSLLQQECYRSDH